MAPIAFESSFFTQRRQSLLFGASSSLLPLVSQYARALEGRPSVSDATPAAYAASKSTTANSLSVQEQELEAIYQKASRGTVAVYDAVTLSAAASQRPGVQEGNGSGVVYRVREKDVVVLTNTHVIENALSRIEKQRKARTNGPDGSNVARVSVQCADGSVRNAPALLIGFDRQRDIAVLSVQICSLGCDFECALQPIPFASDSIEPKVGAIALVIGSPFSLSFFNSMSVGVISGTRRALYTGEGYISNGLQVDASVNPGNSGGPVLNSDGDLVGMATAIVTNVNSSAGVGFAIPAQLINRVVEQIVSNGSAMGPPELGITLASEKCELQSYPYLLAAVPFSVHNSCAAYGGNECRVMRELNAPSGALIQSVKQGSGAEEKGLRGTRRNRAGAIVRGDVIAVADSQSIGGPADLNSVLELKQPGESLSLKIIRDSGDTVDVDVTLQQPEEA